MKAYRYLEPLHAAALMTRGVILVGSIQSFGQLEDNQRDELDAGIEIIGGDNFVARGDNRREREGMAAAGIILKPSARVIGPGSVSLRLTGNALCFSSSAENTAMTSQGKTSIIEVTDVDGFALALTCAAVGQLGVRWQRGPITYRQRRWRDAKLARRASPFIKDEAFRDEQEYRIYWPTKDAEPRLITAPNLRHYVRQVA